MDSDPGIQVGELYGTLKRVYSDLNRLANDYAQMLREEGHDYPSSSWYSYSPATLSVKQEHAWVFYAEDSNDADSNPDDDADSRVSFCAAIVSFEPAYRRRKLLPLDRPELWFIIGHTNTPAKSLAKDALGFLAESDAPYFHPALSPGEVSRYQYKQDDEDWEAVCICVELGNIDSADALLSKVVQPLLDANQRTGEELGRLSPHAPSSRS